MHFSNIKTVLTLHNYRLICPGNQLTVRGVNCEKCIGKDSARVLFYRCFPGGSLLKSFLSWRLYRSTFSKGYYADLIDGYIALTEFGKHLFVKGRIPDSKIYVKPNFIADPQLNAGDSEKTDRAIFIGRLSPEKGILELIRAWEHIDYPLLIVGDGPLMKKARRLAKSNVEFCGSKSHAECLRLLSSSCFMVFSSIWYEGFPLTVLEAFALGVPVLASNLGTRPEIISDGISGVLYRHDSVDDFHDKINKMINETDFRNSLGTAAREQYLKKYTPDINYDKLMEIYKSL